MTKPALIGVDIGTTNIKAVAFAPNGQQLAKATAPNQTHYPQTGWAEYQPDELWATICRVLQTMLADLGDTASPVAIAFSSMAEAAVPLDTTGQPTYPIISWFDQRTIPQADWWRSEIGVEKTAQITGFVPRPVWGVMKLLWLRENETAVFKQTHHWLNMADYGAYKLCGAKATDYSLASRMLLLELATKKWSDELLASCGLSSSLFGELVPSGTVVGRVHAQAAKETGLPLGLPVCSGGHDHVCGALALGINEAGQAFDSMGTAESIMVTLNKPILDGSIAKHNIGQGMHVVPDRYYAMSGVRMSGGAIDWVRRLLLSVAYGDSASAEAYDKLVALAKAVPKGSDGVFFLPHLRQANPPFNDLKARGAFVGLTSETTTGHVARAVLKGLAFEYQRVLENVLQAFDLQLDGLVATGGGTRNGLLMEIKTAVANLPYTIPHVEEATCLGAAMLAGIGVGLYGDFSAATKQITLASQTLTATADDARFYRRRYEKVYLGLYENLMKINEAIHNLHSI